MPTDVTPEEAASAWGPAIASFSIAFGRFLNPEGAAERAIPETLTAERLVALYGAMVLTRLFDEKAVALQRTGRLGTYASSLGQEAVSVGTASAMRPSDVFLPSFREQGGMLWRGVTMEELLAYWGGDERGSNFSGPREDFPICIPVGSQFPHAAGVALAMKQRGEDRAAVAMGGDGSTSKGDFYEAMNLAGVWALPVVFVINNNQWAISVPRTAQTAAQTLAQKAIAAGIPGEQVDGNDVVAVHDATARALERARRGGGPTLVEAVTYRLTDHTTADDARRYRSDADVSPHWAEEPVARLRVYLASRALWTKDQELALLRDSRAKVEASVAAYLAATAAPATDIIDHLYAILPAALRPQRAEILERSGGAHG